MLAVIKSVAGNQTDHSRLPKPVKTRTRENGIMISVSGRKIFVKHGMTVDEAVFRFYLNTKNKECISPEMRSEMLRRLLANNITRQIYMDITGNLPKELVPGRRKRGRPRKSEEPTPADKFKEFTKRHSKELWDTTLQLALGVWVEKIKEDGSGFRVYQKPPHWEALEYFLSHLHGKPTRASKPMSEPKDDKPIDTSMQAGSVTENYS